MAPIPLSLFLVLFVQTTAGELSLPSLPEAVQLLQLEKIRGLKQTILEKEDENQKLEEMIKSVTHNNTLMKDEMIRTISEKENVISDNPEVKDWTENITADKKGFVSHKCFESLISQFLIN